VTIQELSTRINWWLRAFNEGDMTPTPVIEIQIPERPSGAPFVLMSLQLAAFVGTVVNINVCLNTRHRTNLATRSGFIQVLVLPQLGT
jgi:hypothetical protein